MAASGKAGSLRPASPMATRLLNWRAKPTHTTRSRSELLRRQPRWRHQCHAPHLGGRCRVRDTTANRGKRGNPGCSIRTAGQRTTLGGSGSREDRWTPPVTALAWTVSAQTRSMQAAGCRGHRPVAELGFDVRWGGRPHASSLSDSFVISFGPQKLVSWGEGGAVVLRDDATHARILPSSPFLPALPAQFSLTRATNHQFLNCRIHPLAPIIGEIQFGEFNCVGRAAGKAGGQIVSAGGAKGESECGGFHSIYPCLAPPSTPTTAMHRAARHCEAWHCA